MLQVLPILRPFENATYIAIVQNNNTIIYYCTHWKIDAQLQYNTLWTLAIDTLYT